MKKKMFIVGAGLLVFIIGGSALAATNTPPPNPGQPDIYQQMYNNCYGPDGMMSKYYGNGNSANPEGLCGMGNGYNYGNMMGVQ